MYTVVLVKAGSYEPIKLPSICSCLENIEDDPLIFGTIERARDAKLSMEDRFGKTGAEYKIFKLVEVE